MNRDGADWTVGREHLGLALKAAGLGAAEWRRRDDSFFLDARAAEIFGLPTGQTAANGGDFFYETVDAQDRGRIEDIVETALDAAAEFDIEFRVAREDDDAPQVWVRLVGVPVAGEDGVSTGAVAIVEDISERKIEDGRRHTLMSELDHRVKNVLAAVQALAFQTAKRRPRLTASCRPSQAA